MPKTRLPQVNFVFDRYKKATLTNKAAVELGQVCRDGRDHEEYRHAGV